MLDINFSSSIFPVFGAAFCVVFPPDIPPAFFKQNIQVKPDCTDPANSDVSCTEVGPGDALKQSYRAPTHA